MGDSDADAKSAGTNASARRRRSMRFSRASLADAASPAHNGVRSFARLISRTFRHRSKPASELPVLRKRRLVVPISLFDNPYLTETEMEVDARYGQLRCVGTGRFGIVVSAVDAHTGSRVAIKKVFSAFANAHAARHILRELRLLGQLRHPHIVRLLDVDVPHSFRAWDSVYLVTPLLARDLRTALLGGFLDRQAQRRVLAQLVSALRYMHKRRVLHRDVKSLNVLVDGDGNAQLCDLGEARFCGRTCNDGYPTNSPDPELTLGPRTPLQSAPELFLNERYDESVDMWGVGCIAAEMLHPTHRHIFNDPRTRNPLQTIVRVLGYPNSEQTAHLEKRTSHVRLALAATRGRGEDTIRAALSDEAGLVDEEGLDFVERLLCFVPSERMSADEALRHPFLDDAAAEVEAAVAAEIEKDGLSSDLSLTEPPEGTSRARLKELTWKEIIAIHPEAARIHEPT